MSRHPKSLVSIPLLGAWVVVSLANIAAQPAKMPLPPEDLNFVRRQLGWIDNQAYRQALKEFRDVGEHKTFAAFEIILSEPGSIRELSDVFRVLRDLNGDKRRFVDHAVRGLTYPDLRVRERAVQLLAIIGSSAEASPVVALLSDKDFGVSQSAATTLVAIGGPRELVAMDIWLAGIARPSDEETRKHVRQCRAALQKRLDEAREKKK